MRRRPPKQNMPSDLKSDQGLPVIPRGQKWYLRWWSVMMWLATIGPFGLPFLWKSKDFNLFWKWFLTFVVVVVTAVCTWGSWKIIQLTIQEFRNAGLM